MITKIKFKFFQHYIVELGEFDKKAEPVANECMKHMNDVHQAEGNDLKQSFYFLDRSTKIETRIKVNYTGYNQNFDAEYTEMVDKKTPRDDYNEKKRRGQSNNRDNSIDL